MEIRSISFLKSKNLADDCSDESQRWEVISSAIGASTPNFIRVVFTCWRVAEGVQAPEVFVETGGAFWREVNRSSAFESENWALMNFKWVVQHEG